MPRRAQSQAAHLLAAALLAVFATLFAAPAGAQTDTTLVSNLNQTDGVAQTVGHSGSNKFSRAQQFTTGLQNAVLSEVKVTFASSSDLGTPRVSIWTTTADNNPGTRLYTLTNPASFVSGGSIAARTYIFTAPANANLDLKTKYFVVFQETSSDKDYVLRITTGNGQTGESQWSIADRGHTRSSDGGTVRRRRAIAYRPAAGFAATPRGGTGRRAPRVFPCAGLPIRPMRRSTPSRRRAARVWR